MSETFFVEHRRRSMRDLRRRNPTETQGYLVDLLSGFSVSQRIHVPGEPLAILLSRAQATGPERWRLRELGDAALFICGFFPDSFDRRGLSRELRREHGRPGVPGRVGPAARRPAAPRGAARGLRRARRPLPRHGARARRGPRADRDLHAKARSCAFTSAGSRSGSPELANRLQRRGVQPRTPAPARPARTETA